MTLLPRAITIFGAILLAHACYSAQEHASYQRTPSIDPSSSLTTTTTTTSSTVSLPKDIILETLLSVLILCYGLVLGSPALRPVSWHVWAGEVEKEEKKKQCTTHREDAGPDLAGVNPFASLESRIGFWDIRAKRREFDEWVRERDSAVKT